jgi:hypothetical protein
LKILDVDLMLESISSSKFLEWIEYFELEPFGYEIENYRSGIIASAIYNVNRQKETDKVWDTKDFFNKHVETHQQSEEELLSYAKIYTDVFNRKINR